MLQSLTRTIERTKEDRTEFFEELMRKSYRQAYALAMRLAGNAAEAEDLVQEAFVRAYRFFHRYDESLPFTSWLYRILANVHIDFVRRKNRLRLLSLEGQGENNATRDIPDADAVPDRMMLEGIMEETVQLGLQAMTPEFRMAVVLADVEGMAYEEIAEVMETSIGTVRSRIHRGRKQLRDYLKARDPFRFKEVSE